MKQKLQQYLSSITQADLENYENKRITLLNNQELKLRNYITSSIQKILTIRKSRLNTQDFETIQKNFLILETALLNTLQIHLNLLKDKDIIDILTVKQIQEQTASYRKCITRTLDTYNRMTSSTRKSNYKSEELKISKNCKINIQNTLQLQKWLMSNFNSPYPSLEQREKMATSSQLSQSQVNNWFINARQRMIKKLAKRDPKQYQRPSLKFDQEYQSLKLSDQNNLSS